MILQDRRPAKLARLRLARPAVRLYEIALAARSAILGERVHATNGLPVPPARMRVRIGTMRFSRRSAHKARSRRRPVRAASI